MVVWCFSACIVGAQTQPDEGWALHDGDRVVFYGDSITEQHLYTWWVELFAATRFPAERVTFWNAGVGGDRVSGGGGGSIDQRLKRDVFARQPNVLTIMLGMNDGGYVPLTPASDQAYLSGYEHILASVEEKAPGTRTLLIGPSPYDEVTRTEPLFAGGYNRTLIHFGQVDRGLAAAHHASFTDANGPFVTALGGALKQGVTAAQMLVPDRVHPELPAHLLIAAAVLHAWNAPALVSRTEVDAARGIDLPGSRNIHVNDVVAQDGGLRWTSVEEALPWPINPRNAGQALVLQNAPLLKDFDQELVVVHGLRDGSYRLSIDGRDIATRTASEWDAGVNLATERTPMFEQAEAASWTLRDKCELQFVQERIAISQVSAAAIPALDEAQAKLDAMVHTEVQPRPHHFVLAAVVHP